MRWNLTVTVNKAILSVCLRACLQDWIHVHIAADCVHLLNSVCVCVFFPACICEWKLHSLGGNFSESWVLVGGRGCHSRGRRTLRCDRKHGSTCWSRPGPHGHMTTAEVVTWEGTHRCDGSRCLCYITNIGHWTSGKNSHVVCSTKGNISEWTERGEEGVEAIRAGL